MTAKTYHQCSFCDKNQQQVRKLVAGNDVYICNECIDLCYEIIKQDVPTIIPEKDIIPSKIKARLDEHVIGQDNAKRRLAVAVYNHVKRINNPVVDGVEIDKSNMLFIGGSGTGKTYTIQNIAKIMGLPTYPFLKVQHPIGSCTLPELKARAEVAYRQALAILLEA